MKVIWYISWKKLIHLVLLEFKPFKPSIWYNYKILFPKIINIFKELNMSGISRFSFWAIEPIRKDGGGGKFRKPHFNGKRITEMLFHGPELILKLQNFLKLYLDRDFFSRKQRRSHGIMVYFHLVLEFAFLESFIWHI